MANYKNISITTPSDILLVIPTAEKILKETDWTQTNNSGLTSDCVALFKTYRTAIRTIRRTNPSDPTWPDAPTEEWS